MATAKFWRIRAYSIQTTSYDYFTVGELEFREVAGGPSLVTGTNGAPVSSGDHNSSRAKENAFDADPNTAWTAPRYQIDTDSGWIGWGFDAPVEVNEVAIGAFNVSNQGEAIIKGVIECSDDGVDWLHVGLINATSWSQGMVQTFATLPEPLESTIALSNNHIEVAYTSESESRLSTGWIEVAQTAPADVMASTVWIEIVHSIDKPRRRPLNMP